MDSLALASFVVSLPGDLRRLTYRPSFSFAPYDSQGFYDNSSKFVSMLQPRISQAVDNVWTVLHLDVAMRPEINSAHAAYALYVTIFLELVGGVCFVIFPTFGSALIALYLMYITPIMHDFYNHPPGSQQYVAEMIHFLKNVALLGAAFFVMGGRQNSSGKKKLKAQ